MNKLKLLLLGLITVFTLSISNTYAITFQGYSKYENMISGYNNFSYQDGDWGYYSCIWSNYKSSANLKRDSAGCSDGYYTFWQYDSTNGALIINGSIKVSQGGYRLWKKKDAVDVFALPKIRNGEERMYKKYTMKNLGSKMLNVKSQRGENVYDEAFVDGIGFAALLKDQNQVRSAHVIASAYILDGYLLAIGLSDSYIVDTYDNKIYKYNNNFYSSEMRQEGGAQIFPKLWNTVPDQVSDIVRGLPSRNSIYVNRERLSFDMANTQTGTKATLAELRENIKKSIVILDKEGAEYFLGQTPEELGIGAGSPNTDNQLNTSGSTAPKTGGAEEKKACVDYYTKMKSFTAISAACRGESREGQEKYEYWENILFGMYDQYTTRDKVRYWNCYNFGIIKEKWIKSFGKERFDAFQKDWETKYLYSKSEDVDINAMCSHIVTKEAPKMERSFQGVRDFLNGHSGSPIYTSGDLKIFAYDFYADSEYLKGDRDSCFELNFFEKNLLNSGEQASQKKYGCDKYYKRKFEFIEKYKNLKELPNGKTLDQYISDIEQGNTKSDSGILGKFVDNLRQPYDSGYMSVDFVKPICGSYTTTFFDIFVYLFFFGGLVYFLKIFT